MSKSLSIRNVPEELRRKLKERAAQEGISMSELILRVIERALQRPTEEELRQLVGLHPRIDISGGSAQGLRERG